MIEATPDPFSPGLLTRLPEAPRRVALLRPARIGDFICAIPAFRALRAALPGAEITVIALPLLRDLAQRIPYLDRFAAFPGYPGLAEQFFEARRTLRFFREMQEQRLDLAVQMHGSGVNSNPFALMLGARATAGFVRPGDGPGRLDAALPLPATGHEVWRLLALARFLGAEPQGEATAFPLWEADHARAETLLRRARRPLLGLHPGARSATRRWPLERFAALGGQLCQRHGGTLVVVGGPEERARGDRLAALAGGPALNLCGALSLPVLGAVLVRLALFVTNDSGPAHLAYAFGVPTVTIVGGEDSERYGPPRDGPFRVVRHEVPCRPCDEAVCPVDYHCLHAVTVQRVVVAARELVA